MQTGRNTQPFMQRLNSPEQNPAWGLGGAAFFVLAYVVIWIASLTIVSTLRGEIDGQISLDGYLLSAFLANTITIFGVISWARQRLGAEWQRGLGLNPMRGGQFAFTLVLGLGAAWAFDLFGGLTQAKEWWAIPPLFQGLLQPISATWVIGALTALLIQPIAETLIFAGLLYPIAAQRAPNNLSAIIATAFAYMFVSVFLSVQQGAWFVVIYPLLMSIFVIGIRAYTKSTLLATVARIGFGLFVVLVAIIQ